MPVIDYTHSENMEGCPLFDERLMAAHGDGFKFLALSKMSSPFRRFDGKRVSYLVTYRSLSSQCVDAADQSPVCAVTEDSTYFSARELLKLGVLVPNSLKLNPKLKSLFDHFFLF